jgi:putative two-component system response regulator
MGAGLVSREAEPALGRALNMLDLVVLLRNTDGSYALQSSPCGWFEAMWNCSASRNFKIELSGQSDYLDNFLFDAHEFWNSGRPGRLLSGSWVETDPTGQAWPLEAQALVKDGDAFLVIEHLSERYQQQSMQLQTAREHLLNEEVLERKVRQRTAAIRNREQEIALRLISAAAERDGETGSHVRRIGLYAGELGEALGWEISRIEDIKIAAPMHDIGKIGIPDAILRKPGRLSEEEYRVMQGHTVIGGNMLSGSDIPMLEMGREIALCHHEKWNGGGYPNGLRGEGIPVSARIVTIVDVYDAMLSRRVYKDPIPEAEVLNLMAQAVGRDFDPILFDVFMRVLPAIRRVRDANAD